MKGRGRLEEKAREIGALIGAAVPSGVGFGLFIFDFGDGGHLAWISNAQRADMIKSIEELLGRLKGGMGARDTES